MNGSDTELRKELWMWRGVVILLVLILTITTVVTFMRDRDQHAIDNRERAETWTQLKANDNRIIGMINHNFDEIQKVDEHLRQCSGCHSHPKVGDGRR